MTFCAWCHKPIMKDDHPVCFKVYGEGYKFFHNRLSHSQDCWTLYLLDHIQKVKGAVADQFT